MEMFVLFMKCLFIIDESEIMEHVELGYIVHAVRQNRTVIENVLCSILSCLTQEQLIKVVSSTRS